MSSNTSQLPAEQIHLKVERGRGVMPYTVHTQPTATTGFIFSYFFPSRLQDTQKRNERTIEK